MKTNYSSGVFLVLVLLLGPVTSMVAQMQAIGPVGMQNLKVAGTGGTAPSVLTFSGLGLTRPIECQGIAEGVATNSLTDNEANWTDNQFNGANGAHYVEILSGPAPGTTYDIAGTIAASKQITLVQSITGSIGPPPYSYRIRKHRTIANVFGPNNEGGLAGGSSTSADVVQAYNGTTYDTYYYQTIGLGGIGWRKGGAPTIDVSNSIIYPEDGLIITRRQPFSANIVLLGTVKTGYTSLPIFAGQNLVGNVYAANMTLGSSGLYTGSSASGLAGGAMGEADDVLIYNFASASYDTYYYKLGGLGGSGWRHASTGSDATNVSIPAGASIFINRKQAFGFNWRIPQHPTTL